MNIQKLSEILNNEYKFLKEIIKDNEEYCKIIMFILDGKIKQVPSKEYKKKNYKIYFK